MHGRTDGVLIITPMHTERLETLPWLCTTGLHVLVQQWERGSGGSGILGPGTDSELGLTADIASNFGAVLGCVNGAAIAPGNCPSTALPAGQSGKLEKSEANSSRFTGISDCSLNRGNEEALRKGAVQS